MVRFVPSTLPNGAGRVDCSGASAEEPLGQIYGGSLDTQGGLVVKMPVGQYQLCAAWSLPPPSNSPARRELQRARLEALSTWQGAADRRKLQWSGELDELSDEHFIYVPEITAYVDEW